MNILLILVQILNAGIDYDLSRGDTKSAAHKIKARDRVLARATK